MPKMKTSAGKRRGKRARARPRSARIPHAGDRGDARGYRPRDQDTADRHPRAGRAVDDVGARRARARLGGGDQEHGRASRSAHLAHRRCRARRCQGPGAAAGAHPPAPFRRGDRGLARRPGGGQGHCGRGRSLERVAGRGDRRSVAVAGGAGEPDRQCGEVHRARQRAFRGDQRKGSARKGAARLHRVRQRHRPQRGRDQAAVSAVCAGRARPSRAATAAPDWASPSSSVSPKPWAAI